MKRSLDPKQIALSGILTALSVIFFFLSYYVSVATLAFNVAISAIILAGFLAGGYPVAIMIYAATGVLGVIFTNFFNAMPFLLFFGAVPIISVLTRDKIKNKVVQIVVRILYYAAVVALIYLFADVITGERLKEILEKGILYEVVFCLLAVVALYIYELALNYIRPVLDRYVKRFYHKG